jgi:hypothetical protein
MGHYPSSREHESLDALRLSLTWDRGFESAGSPGSQKAPTRSPASPGAIRQGSSPAFFAANIAHVVEQFDAAAGGLIDIDQALLADVTALPEWST